MLLAVPPPPLLLLLLLRCPAGGRPAPPPAAPQRVAFQARTLRHLLLWAPGGTASPRFLYDVQYRRYGNHSWTPVARCTAVACCSCDLTAETAEPSRRYFARVRAVTLDGSSRWTPTGPFSPKEATLQLWNVSLSLSGNTLQVTLGLPVHRGKNSTIAYEDLYPGGWGRYRVRVRRTSDSTEYERMETSRTFELPALSWGERYCVSVEPHLPSWPNPVERTEEQCISTPPAKESAGATATLGLALLGLVAPGLIAVAWVCAYAKKPMETPPVLKSFRTQASPWLLSEPWPCEASGQDLCLEVVPIQQVPIPPPAGVSRPRGAAWPVPEKGVCWTPEASARSGTGSPGLRDLMDSSSCSTDSGICLQEPWSSPGHLRPTGPLACGGLLPGSSRAVEEKLLQAVAPASKEEPVGLDSEEVLKPAHPPHAQISRCQRQEGGPMEVLGSSGCPPSLEGMAQSKPVSVSGYLKQASVAVPSAPRP